MASGEPAEYRVVYPEHVRTMIAAIARRFIRAGAGGQVLADALQAIEHRLRTAPHDFGEPLYRLRWSKAPVHIASRNPLWIDFAIHDEARTVFVMRVISTNMPTA